MSKTSVNSMITKMKKAGIVTKVSPWMHEQGEDVRFVGLKIKDWEDILPSDNNFLAKFGSLNRESWMTLLLANSSPFIPLSKIKVTKESKWELILGSLRQRLNHDKNDYQKGSTDIQNIYVKILKQLKK